MKYIDKDTRHSEKHQGYVTEEIIIKLKEPTARTIGENTFNDPVVAKSDWSDSLGKLNKKFRLSGVERLFKNFKARKERTKALLKKDKSLLTKREKHILQRLKRAPEKATVPALDRIYKLQFDLEPNQFIQDVLDAYNKDPAVEYAELNYIVSIDSTPNDPLYSVQWPLNNRGQLYPESGKYNHPPGKFDADIDAPEAWDIKTGSVDIIVAVADTGVDYNHRDIDDNMWTDPNGYHGYDFFNNDNYPMDDHGHGTHCAGIITAEGNNGLDIAGVCWNVKIMALKFLDETGSGNYADAAEAFYYAVNNGADVISNSWGKDDFSQTMQDAIDYAYSKGVIVVASGGNDNQFYFPHYPASMENVISVAATNSKDEKASFSNYGDWIDISAPGVDILSLRANSTSMGTPYDNYTTIASGTSMACPQIAGILALLLSEYPEVSYEEIFTRLFDNADDISAVNPAYVDRLGSGRANAYKSLRFNSEAVIEFNRSAYSCNDIIELKIRDFDIRGTGTQLITLTTDGGDSETVVLTKESNHPWIFVGTIPTTSGITDQGNGLLEVFDSEIITASYADPNFGDGGPQIVEKTVSADCLQPNISGIEIYSVTSSGAKVKFKTNEPTTGQIRCGSVCGGPYDIFKEDKTLGINHDFYIPDLYNQTDYYFVIDVNDVSGNRTTSTNDGQCYTFSTTVKPEGLHVPGEYPTIQSAIDNAGNGDTVWVADGIYTGIGNRDIDFKGKAITVRSENGPEGCIIDCENSGRGFYFHSNEGADSILDGFTVTHGRTYADQFRYGGGIACKGCGPAIHNCIIKENTAHNGGGGICAGSATVSNCIISDNSSHGAGGIWASQATIINCVISGNRATYDYGGGIICWQDSDAHIINCLIHGNSAKFGGGGIHCASFEESITISNCLITYNRTRVTMGGGGGGGIAVWTNTSPTITNCTLSFNQTASRGDGIGCGNNTHPKITNCILWNNSSNEIERFSGCPIPGNPIVTYSNIRGGWSGVGNIDSDPCFVTGPHGDYYLSQITAGQAVDSPCVDAGSDTAANLGMDICTTRTDQIGDTGIADMGYHYPTITVVRNPDIDGNWHVDLLDYTVLAGDWQNCSVVNLLPGDIVRNGCVDINDFRFLLEFWLDCFVTNATNPQPANEARSADPNRTLSWAHGVGALYHDVYFGTDADAVANAGYLSPEFMGTFSGTSFDPCSLELEKTYYWRIDEVGPACTTQGKVWNFTTKIGLIDWWKFDEGEGSIAYDSAGDNDGTIYGPTWTTGQINGALSFDGMNDYLRVPDHYSLDVGTLNLSFAFWFKTNESSIEHMLAKRSSTTGPSNRVWDGYSAALLADGKVNVHFRHSTSSDSDVVVTSTASYNDGNWHHLAGIYTRSANLEMYVDGVPEGTPGDISYAENKYIDLSQPLAIGCRIVYGRSNDLYFNGTIDDVRIYDQALTAGEIEQLYQNGLVDGP
jgi:subtilisin family serine protease